MFPVPDSFSLTVNFDTVVAALIAAFVYELFKAVAFRAVGAAGQADKQGEGGAEERLQQQQPQQPQNCCDGGVRDEVSHERMRKAGDPSQSIYGPSGRIEVNVGGEKVSVLGEGGG